MNGTQNILFILVDQWPAWCFGHRGADVATPATDRLAADGTVFTNAFTSCPLCSPARGTLLTGRWPCQTGMRDNVGVGYAQQPALDASEQTWVDAAAAAGFRTGYLGKWHLGNDGPAQRGAHAHDPLRNQPSRVFDPVVHEHSYEQTVKKYAGQSDGLERGQPPFWGALRDESEKDRRMSQAVNGGIQFLEECARDRTQPFFLTVSIGPPHFPHYLPPEYAKRAEARAVELPATLRDTFEGRADFHGKAWWPSMDTSGLSDDDWRKTIAYTLTHIEMVDDAIGLLMGKLESLDLAENTTVVFTSDHGDMTGAHGRFDKGPYFYDEVWRIPLIIRRPGCGAVRQEAFCDLLDVAKTLFDLIGAGGTASMPSARSGRDLMPLVGTDAVPADWRQRAYGYYDLYNGMSFAIRAIRDERWAYVWNPQSVDELYDMESDPIQMQNRIDDPAYAEQRTRLRAELNEWIASIGDDLPSRASDLPSAGTIVATGEMGP